MLGHSCFDIIRMARVVRSIATPEYVNIKMNHIASTCNLSFALAHSMTPIYLKKTIPQKIFFDKVEGEGMCSGLERRKNQSA